MSNGTFKNMKNTLSRQQVRKVEDFLLQNFGEITSKKLNKEKAAEYIGEKLGFKVTLANVTSASDAMELQWPKMFTRTGGPGPGKNKGGFKQYQVLRTVCLTLIRVEGLLRELDPNFELPPEVREFAAQVD